MSRHATLAILTVILSGCAGRPPGPTPAPPAPPGPPAALLRAYPATRWIPARPTYAVAARSLREAQLGVRGVLGAATADYLRHALGVDALSPDAVTTIGLDVDGGVAMFSEAVEPTFVVHVSRPDVFAAFVERLPGSGFKIDAATTADGSPLFSTRLPFGSRLSWTVAGEWLWAHVGLPVVRDDGAAWLPASRRPGAPEWVAAWPWTAGAGNPPPVAGFLDTRALIAAAGASAPDAVACARLLAPVGHASLTLDGGVDRASVRVALELGAAAARLGATLHPPPAGWSAAAQRAPIAVQWNVDLDAARAWLAPCLKPVEADLAILDSFGVRTARVIIERYDPDKRTKSRGAVSADLANKRFFAAQLDEIPLRSTLERKRTFGPYAGYSLSIPFGPTVEYVLTDTVALAGLGEGMLASVTAGPDTTPQRLAAIDLSPPAMPREAWAALLDLIGAPHGAVDQLLHWRDGHVTIALDGTRLVLDASGTRR